MEINILKQRRLYPFELKVKLTELRIEQWYRHYHGKIYVAFSGGKDSTVLLDIVRSKYPDVPGVFVNTGLEYPEILSFVKTIEKVIWLKPKMNFKKVIEKYGYPVISKEQSCAISRYRNTKDPIQKYRRLNGWPAGKKGMISKKWQYLINSPFKISDKCCDILKKAPLDKFAKETDRLPMVAMLAGESRGRKMQYLKQGCNAFNNKKPISWPIAFWNNDDIWGYIRKNSLKYSQIYDKGETRTGCMFCMFGVHLEKHPNRFERMLNTHPQQHAFAMDNLGIRKVLEYIEK